MRIEDHLVKMKGGKLYAPVYVRIALFREDHPVSDGWGITAEVIETDEVSCFARACITDPQGRVVATGHKREHRAHFPDFEEKSLTGAVGRALLFAGYGTQYALDELDEGERIVDAPIPGVVNASATVKAKVPGPDPKEEFKTHLERLIPGMKPSDMKLTFYGLMGEGTAFSNENFAVANSLLRMMKTPDALEQYMVKASEGIKTIDG